MSLPRLAVIGCGYWGKNLVREFNGLGALSAVCDAHPDTAAAMAAECGVRALDVAGVLADETIQGVVIAAPAELHADLALKSFAAGKHVYVEKPIALNLADAGSMADAAERSGRILMVGHLLRYHPCFIRLTKLVSSGELGKIDYVYSRRLSLGKLRQSENVLWSFAPHDISMVLALSGADPIEVRGFFASCLQPKIADFASVQMTFDSGLKAHIDVSWLNPIKEQRLVVVGDRAMAEFCDSEPAWEDKLRLYRHRAGIVDGVPEVEKAEAERVVVEKQSPLREECMHFVRCIKTGETPRTDAREAIAVLRVLCAAESERN